MDASLTTVPPAVMVTGLRRETLDDLRVGEPWNAAVVRERVGFTAITSQEIWRDHPEKVLGVTEQIADENPRTVRAICRALYEAGTWIDDAKNKPTAARMLSPAHYVNAPADLIEKRLRGDVGFGDGRTKDFGDGAMTFGARNANYPQLKYVTWWLTQLRRWGMTDGPVAYDAVARRVARFDLLVGAGPDRGVVFQAPCLLPWLTAMGNVMLGIDQGAGDRIFWIAPAQTSHMARLRVPAGLVQSYQL